MSQNTSFQLLEVTIEDIHEAYESGELTARELVQRYLDRIVAYDRAGPEINSIITVNPRALGEAAQLDDALRDSGFVGPLHGIPVILKDQVDTVGMPTTLGSVLFEDYYPDRDAFVTERLKRSGAIILGKATLGELAGGDTHGSLFGSTRNPYDLDRTVGGSSGGSAAAVAANFSTVSVGQEVLASIRRPATWNAVVGLRPTVGLVSRTGVYGSWPINTGTLGPMGRTVTDVARLMDVLAAYDPEDPLTASGAAHIPETYRLFLDANGLQGARLGVLRESIGIASEPDSEDFAKVATVFERALADLRGAGAELVDPVTIPRLNELLSTRTSSPAQNSEGFLAYMGRSRNPPFSSWEQVISSPRFGEVVRATRLRLQNPDPDETKFNTYLAARDELMIHVLNVMAEHELDAIVYKGIEHQPTLIEDGTGPPWVNTKGASYLNAFLNFVPAIVVPAGFTTDDLPTAITFLARPYEDGTVFRLAYAFEQATQHRKPPDSTPPL